MRFDVNVSLSKTDKLSTTKQKTSIPLSGEKAVEYEIKRQTGCGPKVAQETRGWDDAKQRS